MSVHLILGYVVCRLVIIIQKLIMILLIMLQMFTQMRLLRQPLNQLLLMLGVTPKGHVTLLIA